ncbi:hypothetical protein HRbin36_00479 [bacterium HR36]|nr:hypothetical protein HRbin36_00479 [bacterium HR36]
MGDNFSRLLQGERRTPCQPHPFCFDRHTVRHATPILAAYAHCGLFPCAVVGAVEDLVGRAPFPGATTRTRPTDHLQGQGLAQGQTFDAEIPPAIPASPFMHARRDLEKLLRLVALQNADVASWEISSDSPTPWFSLHHEKGAN